MVSADRCYNIADLRAAAKRRLPKWLFEFVDRGTEDEVGMAHNYGAFERIKLANKVLVDMSNRDLGTSLFGKRLAFPAIIAPTGAAGLCWYEGELELAKAAREFGIPFTMAIASTTPLAKVASEAGGALWFQIYIWENRKLTYDLLKRVEAAGYETLVVTVDVNIGVNREFNARNGFSNPFYPNYSNVRDVLLRPAWLTSVLARYVMTSGMPQQANYPPELMNPHGGIRPGNQGTETWDDFARIREAWRGPLIIKGLTRPEDAERAVALGADGIVVSNHGGRNLDSSCASIEALPAIAAAVGDRTTILLDSGIRRGSDIVKALALGAKAVLIGRSTLWGAAVGGKVGALRALSLLQREYELTLGHIGCLSAEELGRHIFFENEHPGAIPGGNDRTKKATQPAVS